MATSSRPRCTVIVIGAGFSGLTFSCQLKRFYGIDDYYLYDRQGGIGGTWRANIYPGCGVDIPGFCYSLSFALNPNFTELFPRQGEILDYMLQVATEYGVAKHFTGRTEWKDATWRESTRTWLVTLEDLQTGQTFVQECRLLISAVGGLVNPHCPQIPGITNFQGHVMHTAAWDTDADLSGKSVAVIGNGGELGSIRPF